MLQDPVDAGRVLSQCAPRTLVSHCKPPHGVLAVLVAGGYPAVARPAVADLGIKKSHGTCE